MLNVRENVDVPTMVVIVITLALFTIALFTTGFTHDLLLETAVFLVSIKIIILSYQSASRAQSMNEKLDRIYTELLHAEALLVEDESEGNGPSVLIPPLGRQIWWVAGVGRLLPLGVPG